VLTEDLKTQILQHIVHPVRPPSELRQHVQAFLYDELSIDSYEQICPVEWGSSYRWDFCFDSQGKLVPYVRSNVPYKSVQGFSKVSTLISRRGPFVTAESYAVGPYEDGGTIFKQEFPVSAKAAALAQQVAQRFGLTYVDAAELHAWELDESAADAAGVDFEDEGWETPNAFILLF
jgi:hypothetical protein